MTRKKVKLAFISDESARKTTFKKRTKGIIKKVSELSILCGIPVCAIISSPFDSQIEVWPNPEGAKQVIEKYKNSYVIDQSKNVNQESFLRQRIAKARDQLAKLQRENCEKELTMDVFKYMQNKSLPKDLTIEKLKDLNKLIEKKKKKIEIKIAALG